jgi:hypothetical protein
MRFSAKLKLNKNRFIIIFILIGVVLLFKYSFKNKNDELINEILTNNDKIVSSVNLNVYDLLKEPQETSEYHSIYCRKSKQIFDIVTTLCIHDVSQDKYVSSSILVNGVWEEEIVTEVLRILRENPDWLFLGLCLK